MLSQSGKGSMLKALVDWILTIINSGSEMINGLSTKVDVNINNFSYKEDLIADEL